MCSAEGRSSGREDKEEDDEENELAAAAVSDWQMAGWLQQLRLPLVIPFLACSYTAFPLFLLLLPGSSHQHTTFFSSIKCEPCSNDSRQQRSRRKLPLFFEEALPQSCLKGPPCISLLSGIFVALRVRLLPSLPISFFLQQRRDGLKKTFFFFPFSFFSRTSFTVVCSFSL